MAEVTSRCILKYIKNQPSMTDLSFCILYRWKTVERNNELTIEFYKAQNEKLAAIEDQFRLLQK
ncbi:hypothetical protein J32TS6_36830 [Virgibacillus pantothenticus]|nr:hypothetical protein J32TS6_36830 [Virgibacillus pantothenticus]